MLVGAGAQSEAEEILALIAEFPTLQERLKAATLVSGRRWDLTLRNDIVIMLPEEDPIPALVQLEALDQSQQILSRDIQTIDLRLADRVVVGLREGVAETVAENVAAERGGNR
jgi:cell division protein FtsQ